MRNLGRAVAAFMIGTAASAVFAQSAAPDSEVHASISVAPMLVTQVNVTSEPATATSTAPIAAPRSGPPPIVAVPGAVYVTHFIAAPAGAEPSGLLSRLRAALHAHAAGRDAGLVAQAVVQRLNHAGVATRYLAPGEPLPVMGWLIGGVFHLQSDATAAASESAEPEAGREAAGAEVSITVADLEHSADTPFAVLGAPLGASGEQSAQSQWRPYVVPAKLSFERADRNTAIAALAQQIVDAFVGNMTALRQADARSIAP
ncbi:MAG: hypothetical protein EPN57_24820 [Paraburkholderia sp.]|nr:MAG: hypothetical protein EPN57_24820 [Paraburkholderia sp.]